jgi:hypothetical protein
VCGLHDPHSYVYGSPPKSLSPTSLRASFPDSKFPHNLHTPSRSGARSSTGTARKQRPNNFTQRENMAADVAAACQHVGSFSLAPSTSLNLYFFSLNTPANTPTHTIHVWRALGHKCHACNVPPKWSPNTGCHRSSPSAQGYTNVSHVNAKARPCVCSTRTTRLLAWAGGCRRPARG